MFTRRNYIVVLLFAMILIITGIWIVRIISGQPLYLDELTRTFAKEVAGTTIYTVFRWITELGSSTFLTPFTIIVSMLLWRAFRDWLPALVFVLGTLSSHGLNILIKQLVERERPSILVAAHAEGYSFPSGHAMIPMVCYGFLAYLLAQKLHSSKKAVVIQFALALLILLIGLSRYVINVHYLTDVLAGFIFGFIFLLGQIYVYKWLRAKWT
ncbi:phosphatase PAP2 family protein [Lentibacillus cibarius]|uniref:Phosphatase PAP2 family protein n=1 Tax=Lentibacillus cibarius TaxID=2583219 RepID=A0A5S3QN02_9BACI|nr:phosphatase PAP2 family protein [Lentibacillus cibarius]TMN23038.1 phosphatase PAP2 family protein [Lentibacillus cibarius]